MDLYVDTIVSEGQNAFIISHEDKGSMFLWNVDCIYLKVHMAILPRKPTSTSSLLWELQLSYWQICFVSKWTTTLQIFRICSLAPPLSFSNAWAAVILVVAIRSDWVTTQLQNNLHADLIKLSLIIWKLLEYTKRQHSSINTFSFYKKKSQQ